MTRPRVGIGKCTSHLLALLDPLNVLIAMDLPRNSFAQVMTLTYDGRRSGTRCVRLVTRRIGMGRVTRATSLGTTCLNNWASTTLSAFLVEHKVTSQPTDGVETARMTTLPTVPTSMDLTHCALWRLTTQMQQTRNHFSFISHGRMCMPRTRCVSQQCLLP